MTGLSFNIAVRAGRYVREWTREMAWAGYIKVLWTYNYATSKHEAHEEKATAFVVFDRAEYVYHWDEPDANGMVSCILDSGCTHSCIGLPPAAFENFQKCTLLISGHKKGAEPLRAIGKGVWNGMSNVYCVPGLHSNLISEMTLMKQVQSKGLGYRYDGGTMNKSFFLPNGQKLFTARPNRGLWRMRLPASTKKTGRALLLGGKHINPAIQAHEALGHCSYQVLEAMNRAGLITPKLSKEAMTKAKSVPCDGCQLSKCTRARKPTAKDECIRPDPDVMGQFSMDIVTLSSPDIQGHKYALVFWDKRTGSIFPALLKKRNGRTVADKLKRYLQKVVLPNTKAKRFSAQILRSDGASEFLSKEVYRVCAEFNI